MGNEKETIRIYKDSQKSRSKDISPTKLAKELGCSTNTVKNRLNRLNIKKAEPTTETPYPSSAFVINEFTQYQLFNYECLPILKAYLGFKKLPSNPEEFYQRIKTELDKDPDQTACKDYLFGNDTFREYYLHSEFSQAIRQRFQCIQKLAEHLDVYPATEVLSPYYAQSGMTVLSHLDRLIYEFANLIPAEVSPSTPIKNTPEEIDISELTKAWCKELISFREDIFKPNGEITYSFDATATPPPVTQIIAEQMGRKFSDRTQRIAANIRPILAELQTLHTFLFETDPESLHKTIQSTLVTYAEKYIEACLTQKIAPDLDFPKDMSLPSFVRQLIFEEVERLRYATEKLEKYYFSLNTWFTLNEAFGDAYILKDAAEFPMNHTRKLNALLRANM